MKFINLKLGTKQSIGFGLILIIMVGVNIFSRNKLVTIKNEIDDVTTNWFPRAIAISEINLNTSDLRLNQLQHAFATAEAKKQEQADIMITLIDDISENLDTYTQLKTYSEKRNLYSEEERKLYSEFDRKWERYLDLSFSFLDLSHNNENQKAIDLLDGEARQVFNDFSMDLQELVRVNKKDAYDAAKRADALYRSTRNINVILLITTILISILMAAGLVRFITMPVQQLADAAGNVARGDLNVKLDISSKDEIGNLAHSFNQMTASLREAKEKTQQQAEKLQMQHQELHTLNTELEKKSLSLKKQNVEIENQVTERTAELAEANTALQSALSEVEQLKNRLQAENIYLQDEIKIEHNFADIISRSEQLNKVLRQVEQVASTDATVLIIGESGTGKELLARAVHNLSARRERPLVKVDCATLPPNLIESELFGHEKGAFTGAYTRKIGRFELADAGTIFLDEIGDLPLELQSKLLRILQEGEFERLGDPHTIKVDVRVIAATNHDLEKAIEYKQFREDLFYRLNVFPIKSPPLRDRKEDIPLLVNHFIKKYGAKTGKNIETISQNVVDTLQSYHWPGNVRELENIIERAVIISEGKQLQLGDWVPKTNITTSELSFSTLEENERKYIIDVLNSTNWRVSGERGAAKILGLKRTTLESRMKKLSITRL